MPIRTCRYRPFSAYRLVSPGHGERRALEKLDSLSVSQGFSECLPLPSFSFGAVIRVFKPRFIHAPLTAGHIAPEEFLLRFLPGLFTSPSFFCVRIRLVRLLVIRWLVRELVLGGKRGTDWLLFLFFFKFALMSPG